MCLVYAICVRNEGGFKSDQEHFDKSGIKIGDKIRVLEAKVDRWITDVYLEGYDGRFNSVFFNYVDKDEMPYNIYKKPGFYEFYKEI
jgi:hypothetical protein